LIWLWLLGLHWDDLVLVFWAGLEFSNECDV